jgi:hypothetical protein
LYARDALQFDPAPGRRRGPSHLVEELLGPSPQGDELDPLAIQLAEVGIGRQLRVKDEFLGQAPGPLLPEVDEAEDLVVLLVLAQLAIGVAEDAGLGILGQERQDSLLPPTSLRDVVFLDQGVVAVEGDRVEVEVERRPPLQSQATDRVEPVAHQLRVAGRFDSATVFGQERPLRNHVQPGEQGQALVEHGAHHVTVTCIAKELQGQQRPHGACGRDHLRPGETAPREELLQVGRGDPRQEQEQATELGAKAAWFQVEPAHVGHVGHDGTGLMGPLVVAAPRQLGEALFLQDHGDRRRAERLAVAGEGAADIMDGEVLLAQRDDLIPQSLLLAGWSALACGREEEVALGLIAELMNEDPETPRRVSEPRGRFSGRKTVDEEGPQGLVVSVGGIGWFQEPASQC